MDAINIQDKFDLFTDQWSPKKIGELNGQQILLAKIQESSSFTSMMMKTSCSW